MKGSRIEKKTRMEQTALIFISVLFAFYCTMSNFGEVSLKKVLLTLFLYFFFFYLICVGLLHFAKIFLPRFHIKGLEQIIYEQWSERKFFWTIWFIFAVTWSFAYLAFFPGIFGYDAPGQMAQIVSSIYSTHHPIFHTWLLGIFMNTGYAVSGSYNVGVGLYCTFQGLCVTLGIAYSFLVFRRYRIPFPVLVLCLIGCGCNPLIHVLSFNITKDILFGVCFLQLIMQLYVWVSDEKKQNTVKLMFTGILFCLLRNQGIYILIVLLFVCLIGYRKEKKLILTILGIVLCSQLFFTFTTRILQYSKGDAREMLSVPMQQMAWVCKQYQDGEAVNLSQEDYQMFLRLVPEEHIGNLLMFSADPVKSYFNTEELKQHIGEYVSLYLRIGIHNSKSYISAWRCLVKPYWSASANFARDLVYTNTFEDVSSLWGIEQNSKWQFYRDFCIDYISNGIVAVTDANIPIVSWLLQPGLCIWVMTAFLGYGIGQKDRSILLSGITGFLLFGTILLGPQGLFRYIFPLMIAVPWFIAVLCGKIEGTVKESEMG